MTAEHSDHPGASDSGTAGASPHEVSPEAAGAWSRARAACDATVTSLQAAGIAPKALANLVPERRVMFITKRATMQQLGEVWRLGTLLLGTDGALYAQGRSTRSRERGRPSYQSESREERRDIAAAALRGGYEEGSPVNFDASLLLAASAAVPDQFAASTSSPVGLFDGEVRVRWRAGAPLAGASTLSAFLAERAGLLINPPA